MGKGVASLKNSFAAGLYQCSELFRRRHPERRRFSAGAKDLKQYNFEEREIPWPADENAAFRDDAIESALSLRDSFASHTLQ
jgi:hypothetical protein